MSQAYFAVIDRHGLRALQPETSSGLLRAAKLRRQVNGVLYWAVATEDVAGLLRELLEAAEFHTALVLLATMVEHYGPVASVADFDGPPRLLAA